MIRPISILLLSTSLSCLSYADTQPSTAEIENTSSGYTVKIGNELFTQFVQGEQKPYLYPVIGPTGINMTRNFPMKADVPGERMDHPWHSSLYFAHGSVNGLDFWNDRTDEQQTLKIERIAIEDYGNINPHKARLVATHKWTNGNTTIMTDRTEIVFSGDNNKRVVDYTITLKASHGTIQLGDTKEGCMAVRMHHKLRVKDQGAQVINSEGNTGEAVWGKKARWISYYNEIEDEVLGISLFDHPDNLRYPTTWHARDYGLCAANPFGLQYFMPEKTLKGDVVINNGDSLTFTYRIIFHKGTPTEANISHLHQEWIQSNRN